MSLTSFWILCSLPFTFVHVFIYFTHTYDLHGHEEKIRERTKPHISGLVCVCFWFLGFLLIFGVLGVLDSFYEVPVGSKEGYAVNVSVLDEEDRQMGKRKEGMGPVARKREENPLGSLMDWKMWTGYYERVEYHKMKVSWGRQVLHRLPILEIAVESFYYGIIVASGANYLLVLFMIWELLKSLVMWCSLLLRCKKKKIANSFLQESSIIFTNLLNSVLFVHYEASLEAFFPLITLAFGLATSCAVILYTLNWITFFNV